MPKKVFTAKEAISYGWQTFKKKAGFFIILALIYLVINFIGESISDKSGDLGALITILFYILGIVVSIGFLKIGLAIHDGKKAEMSDLFKTDFSTFLNFFLTQILTGLIILLGLLLLIIPGIIWALKYQFALNLVVDKKMGPLDALGKSAEITKGQKLNLLVLNLAFLGVSILGALALGVGILVAIPVIFMADIYVYRKLLGEAKS